MSEERTYKNKPFADGFYFGVDERLYREDPAVAISDLKEMALSPMHFWSKRFGDYRPERTGAQVVGTLVHLAVLEPDVFRSSVITVPDDAPKKPTAAQRGAKKPSDATIEAIEWWDDWERKNAGATVVAKDELARIAAIANCVRSHPDAASLLDGSRTETGMFLTRQFGDKFLRVKGKLDVDARGDVLADIKTVDRGYANPYDFGKSIRKWAYHQQAAHYIDTYNALLRKFHKDEFEEPALKKRWVFIVVEKEPPYAVATMELDPGDIDYGRELNDERFKRVAECMDRDEWPCMPTERQSVKMPRF